VRVEPAVLRTTLATVLIGAGVALLIKAGLGIPTWVLVPFPVGVVVLLIVTMVREHRKRERRRIQQEANAPASGPEPGVLNP
jgi:cytochrome c-type biogenesis protein CcmH/NrfF